MIGLGLSLTTRAVLGLSFNPLSLFAAGEQGILIDPSDLSTLFTDTAGTTPVTAPGQTAALALDKSGRGNQLTQSVAAARPIYGRHPARGYVNQLVNSDTVVTQNVTVAGVAMTLSFTGTGTVTLSGASTAGPLVGTGANDRVSLAFTPSAGTLTLTVSGDVRLGQLERGTLTAYQRTGAGNGLAFPRPVSYDITEAGQPSLHYLFCDGLARWMVSPTITPGTDKAQVFAGLRNLNSLVAALVEFSPSTAANNGAFIIAPRESVANYLFSSKGTISAQVRTPANYTPPISNVVTGLGDISGDTSTIRVNGAQVATSATDQGTGNYLAYPLYIGSRAGTSLFFNGLIYSIIVRFGPNLPLATIQQVERWTAQKTGVTL